MSLFFALFLASIPLDPVPKQEIAYQTSGVITATATTTRAAELTYTYPKTLSISCDKGFIVINFITGEVKIPEGTKMPAAARAFWEQVTKAFPEFKQSIIEAEKARKKEGK